MFCANCGKQISAGSKCPQCGAEGESLRSFKKLDVDTASIGIYEVQQPKPQITTVVEEKIIYKNNPRQKRIIFILIVLAAVFVLTAVTALIYSQGVKDKLKEVQSSKSFPVSENSYNVSGTIEYDDNNYAFINLTDTLEFDIADDRYEANELYLSPDISVTGSTTEIEGRICKLSGNTFMIIKN